MKVPIYTTVEVDTEVSIGAEEITGALWESLRQAELAAADDNEDRQKYRRACINGVFNCIWQVLKGVTDEMLDEMKSEHRQIVVEHLSKELERIRPKQEPAAT